MSTVTKERVSKRITRYTVELARINDALNELDNVKDILFYNVHSPAYKNISSAVSNLKVRRKEVLKAIDTLTEVKL